MIVPGIKVLLSGGTGSGKTYSFRTLIEAGITPFVIATEPGIEATLGDIEDPHIHWKYIPPAAQTWDDLLEGATKVNTLSYKALSNLDDISKRKYHQFLDLITCLANFTCDRCGQSFGCVDDWGTDRALSIDSLSGVNIMALEMVVGAKPVRSQGEWGIAMDYLEKLITRLCAGVPCHFILTSHMQMISDEQTGQQQLMPLVLGQKLAPKIPRFFDDVIQTTQKGGKFYWHTASLRADLKARHIPIGENLPPTFLPIIENWKSKGGEIISTSESSQCSSPTPPSSPNATTTLHAPTRAPKPPASPTPSDG